jgi:hypothetical protein
MNYAEKLLREVLQRMPILGIIPNPIQKNFTIKQKLNKCCARKYYFIEET